VQLTNRVRYLQIKPKSLITRQMASAGAWITIVLETCAML
jgi:hypothetical protein